MGFGVVNSTFDQDIGDTVEGSFGEFGEAVGGSRESRSGAGGSGAGGGDATLAPNRRLQLVRLQQEVARRQARWREEFRESRCPSGWKAVDQLLQGGFPRGRISVVSGPAGSGRTSLAAGVVARLTGRGELCAWIDPQGTLNPGALDSFGVVLDRLLWVRARENRSNHRSHFSGPGSRGSSAGHRRSESSWAAHLLARSGAFALVVVELCGERLSLGAGARLAEAARSGNTAVVVLASEHDADVPQAALKLRLEPSVELGPRLVHGASEPAASGTRTGHFDRPSPVERSNPAGRMASVEGSGPVAGLRHRRCVHLVVERTRRGAPCSGPVSFPPPFRQPPPWSTHQPFHSPSGRKDSAHSRHLGKHVRSKLPTVGGALEVLPFTDKLHSGRPARHRVLDEADASPNPNSTARRTPTSTSSPLPASTPALAPIPVPTPTPFPTPFPAPTAAPTAASISEATPVQTPALPSTSSSTSLSIPASTPESNSARESEA